MKAMIVIAVEDGRYKVSKWDIHASGQYVEALNWRNLEPQARKEADKQGARITSYGQYDISDELAQQAIWDEVFIQYWSDEAMVVRWESGFLLPALNAPDLEDDALLEARAMDARLHGYYPISDELAARAEW